MSDEHTQLFDERFLQKIDENVVRLNASWYFRQMKHSGINFDLVGPDDITEIWETREEDEELYEIEVHFDGNDPSRKLVEIVRFNNGQVLLSYERDNAVAMEMLPNETTLIFRVSVWKVTRELLF